MVIGVITLLAMLVFSCETGRWKNENRLFSLFAYGQMYFWSSYILISALLMWLDIFRILYAAAGTLLISLLIFWTDHFTHKRKWRMEKKLIIPDKKEIIVLTACILMAVAIHDKNELYGMSQDEGVFQTIAISYMNENNSNQKTIEEYEVLGGENRTAFLNKMNSVISGEMHGYYFFRKDYIPRNIQTQNNATSGYYHGIPTYASTMALWGSVFGWKQMMGVQSLFYILAVFLFYELLQKVNLSALIQMLVISIYMLSPIMLWLGKSSLSELLLTCLLNWFLCELLSDKSEKDGAVQIALPVIAFAFVHLTIYTLMPMFIVCLLIRFWNDRGVIFLKTGLYITAGYLAGILFTAWCYTEYFYLNVKVVTRFPFVDDGNVLIILILFGVVSATLFATLYFYKGKLPRFSSARQTWGIRIIAGIFATGNCWIIVKAVLKGGQWEKLTIVSYALLTGVASLPIIFAFLLIKTKIFSHDWKKGIIIWFFFYCVLFYAVLFRREIINHYYGDRYLAPFLVGILLMLGIALEHICLKRLGKGLIAAFSIAALGYLVYHSGYVVRYKDDTRIEWDFLEKICEELEEDDVVIMDDYCMTSCFFPIRDMTGAYCYPIFGEDIQKTANELMFLGRDIFFLGRSEELPQGYETIGEWKINYFEYAGLENDGIFDPLNMKNASFEEEWRLVRLPDM